MQQEKNKAIICWISAAAYMGIIFWLSSRTAEESSQQSGAVLQWLINVFGDNGFTDFIVRKSAHCLEFAGLCVLFNLALLHTKSRKMPLLSIACTSLYAVTDELHQLFVDGRSCQLSDWAIDSCGAMLGTIGFLLLCAVISRILQKR